MEVCSTCGGNGSIEVYYYPLPNTRKWKKDICLECQGLGVKAIACIEDQLDSGL